ncbi:MAG: alpha-L-fucosidase [Verrucomicrobiia bacterium]
MNPKTSILFLIGAIALTGCKTPQVAQKRDIENETPSQYEERLRWWREARFGMFIHWGPVSIKGTEIGWSRGAQVPVEEYDKLYLSFNPTNFNANLWAKIARDTGMKYLVLTSKHHDGFCLWDSKYTDYDIMRTPFGRDVVKELAAACKRYGVVFCLYHSICDWHHPDYPLGSPGGKTQKPNPNMDSYNRYLTNQLAELLTNYGKIGVLWFDGDWEKPWSQERGIELYKTVRRLQPDIIVNNRVGVGRQGMAGTTAAGKFGGDFDTPEQRIGNFQLNRPWESCITICQQWAWKPNDRLKSLKECVQTLVRCAGGDGNLLLNIGPMPDGSIEDRQIDRLLQIGEWIKKYGNTIYKTRGGPYITTSDLASTRAGSKIYIHILKWGEDEYLRLPPLPARIKKAKIITGGRMSFNQTPEFVELFVPEIFRDEIDTIIELTIDKPAMEIQPIRLMSSSITTGKKATASNIYRNMDEFAPSKAIDGDPETRWATDSGIKNAFLQVNLGEPKTFNTIVINEAYAGRVSAFELKYLENGNWKILLKGNRLGERFEKTFPKIKAQIVRLEILNASDGPTISEFNLYLKN